MSEAHSAAERLPWLSDKAPIGAPAKRGRSGSALFVAGAASAAIVLGGWSLFQNFSATGPQPAAPVQTVPLPAPLTAPPLEQAEPQQPSVGEREALSPVAEELAAPQTRAVKSKAGAPASSRRTIAAEQPTAAAAAAPGADSEPQVAAPAAPVAAPAAQPRQLWPARQAAGAGGRLVQIGAFGTRQQAKLGWRRMQRSYPAVGNLPAVVVDARNSKGRKFYRFQIGTTSHAHSEILCQRMQRIDYSCAVIGLPWKAKIER